MSLPRICPSCQCVFHQDFVCTTCGAEKLRDETVRVQQKQSEALQAELRTERMNTEVWRRDAEGKLEDRTEAYHQIETLQAELADLKMQIAIKDDCLEVERTECDKLEAELAACRKEAVFSTIAAKDAVIERLREALAGQGGYQARQKALAIKEQS